MQFLYDIIILPIESIIEFVFCFVLDKFEKFGVAGAIVAVSLVVNFLALPIYNVADEIQLKERELQKNMSHWIAHIKKYFKGDEQFMILSEYYRLNNYHPIYTLRQSFSVLIQIPFFIAAYHFLSHCSLLENQSILFLKDLSKPDALVPVMGGGINNSGFALNLLPILMTAINVVSSIIYTKDAPLREKIQTFALAGIFLVLLYNSPSGLVFYWVLNQIFSLCKNVVKKMKHPGKILHGCLCAMPVTASGYFVLFNDDKLSLTKCCFYLLTLFFIFAPFAWNFLKSKKLFEKINSSSFAVSNKQNFALLLLSCISLCLLCGFLLPSSVIATSPVEFSFLGNTDSPLSYVWSSLVFFAGLFVFWPLVIYKMFGDNRNVKNFMPPLFFVLAMCALANAFLFKYDYGTISVTFKLDNVNVIEDFSLFYSLVPLLMLFVLISICCLAGKYYLQKFLCAFLLAVCLAQSFIGIKNIRKISNGFDSFVKSNDAKVEKEKLSKKVAVYNLSKTQPNVFILFLDRAISCFFPYILEQFPELKNSFDGFTYYPNTLSFADFTNCGTPAMCGGYDYTIDAINKRDDVLLKDKHNEALKLLPTVFINAGFESSIYHLPYEDYNSGNDIWENTGVQKLDFPNKLKDKFFIDNQDLTFTDNEKNKISDIVNTRIKSFSILQTIYPPVRYKIYNGGAYFHSEDLSAGGIREPFLNEYIKLYYFPLVTSFSSEKPTFHYLGNTVTHEYTALREGYVPGFIDEVHPTAGTGVYQTLQGDDGSSENDFLAYHVNTAALLQVGKWLDYLKENEAYDNTRIIIVADHGRGIKLPCFENFADWYDVGFLNPLLLVKDFNSHGKPVTNMEFHTNADVPYFATKDLEVSKVNPFTGNKFRKSSDFDSFNVYRIVEWQIEKYEGKTQFPLKGKKAYNVHGNIFDEKNWTKLDTSEASK